MAVYVRAPTDVLQFTVTSVCFVVPFEPVHPKNVYPSLVGLLNVNLGVKPLYVAGLFPVAVPSARL